MEAITDFFTPYRDIVLFVHVISTMIWLWSAAIAYTWLLRPAWLNWKNSPTDKDAKLIRNWVFEQYDKGLEFEHLAMVVVFISGPLLFLIDDWTVHQAKWMFYKLCIAFLVFLPLEAIDCYLAHFQGNKRKIREQGGSEETYEKYMKYNWVFLQLSAPVAVLGILVGFYLAIIKPVL